MNLSPPTLEFSRNKQISNNIDQELKTPSYTPHPEQSFTNRVTEHQKKLLCDLPSQKMKPDICNESSCSTDAPFCS